MAESETRLETLEDEVKVLKGEVKRTLVDLRALLMHEDSPLADGALTRRAPTPDQGADDEIGGSAPVGMSGHTGPLPADLTAPEGPGATGSQQSASRPGDGLTGPAAGLPSDDLPGAPPQPGPGPGPIPVKGPGEGPGSQAGQGESPPHTDGAEAHPHSFNHHESPQAQKGPAAEEPGSGQDPRARNGRGRLGHEASPAGAEGDGQNQRSGSVYDEYRELLEETRQTPAVEDSPSGPPLDINLLSNLVYWTARAKQRVGEAQLREILQLYVQSGHSRPELQDLIVQISTMVDAAPTYDGENPRDWVELMFHLHGILTGGLPVIKLPRIQLWQQDDAQKDRG